jgi:ATP synthase protein I
VFLARPAEERDVTKRDEQTGDRQQDHQENQRRPKTEERPNERRRSEPRDEDGLKARLDKLSNALDAHQDERGASEQDRDPLQSGSLGGAMSLGFRVLSEFVAAVVVGAFIGWQLDTWLRTSPAFLLIFLLFGTAAGFWNVYRIAVKPPGSKGGLI